jgi:hypothetical protein
LIIFPVVPPVVDLRKMPWGSPGVLELDVALTAIPEDTVTETGTGTEMGIVIVFSFSFQVDILYAPRTGMK